MNCDICGNKICDSEECLFDGECCSLLMQSAATPILFCRGIYINNYLYRYINCCRDCGNGKRDIFATIEDVPPQIRDKIYAEEL